MARIVDYNIYDREREFISGTCHIQITEVNVNSDLPILLGDGHNIGSPVRVLFFPDETGVYELFNF